MVLLRTTGKLIRNLACQVANEKGCVIFAETWSGSCRDLHHHSGGKWRERALFLATLWGTAGLNLVGFSRAWRRRVSRKQRQPDLSDLFNPSFDLLEELHPFALFFATVSPTRTATLPTVLLTFASSRPMTYSAADPVITFQQPPTPATNTLVPESHVNTLNLHFLTRSRAAANQPYIHQDFRFTRSPSSSLQYPVADNSPPGRILPAILPATTGPIQLPPATT